MRGVGFVACIDYGIYHSYSGILSEDYLNNRYEYIVVMEHVIMQRVGIIIV